MVTIKITEKDIIDRVIHNGNFDLINKFNINLNEFNNCKEYAEFIIDYNSKYGAVPTENVMSGHFTEYIKGFIDAPDAFIGENFNKCKHRNKLAKIIEDWVPLFNAEDSIEMADQLLADVGELQAKITSTHSLGYDIVANAQDRYDKYIRKGTTEDNVEVISTGIPELDRHIVGIEKNDYITIVARPNMGKSWIAQYLGVMAWRQGKRVLMYSGEMDVESMGYRFDTWNGNFSNFGTRTGSDDLGEGKSAKGYENYIKDLTTKDGFIVVTPKDLGGKKATLLDIQRLIRAHKPDLIILDQTSLLDDYRGGNVTTTQKYERISTDILTMVTTLQIPVILVAQAKRSEAKKSAKECNSGDAKDSKNPGIDDIMSSDKIGQDSTKVITLWAKDGMLNLNVAKSRHGARDEDVKMKWNIDKGILEPLLTEEENNSINNRHEDYGF